MCAMLSREIGVCNAGALLEQLLHAVISLLVVAGKRLPLH